ncbi:MAG: hypothetical protein IJX76_08975 [Clostridia bacterium]|nr:hypothetical protein [Clostridia bacterium]
MAKFTSTKQQTCGIALGGIGTGSVELFPDGEFHQFQIYNTPRWATCCRENKVDDGEGHTGDLSFWVRTEIEGEAPIVRKLGQKTDPDEFTYRMYAWNKPVEEIAFDGRFPVCDLDYRDPALPIKLSLRAVSPFVPHDADASGTPGFYLTFQVKNPTDKPIKVSLLGRSLGAFLNPEGRQSRVVAQDGRVALLSSSQGTASDHGSLCLSVEGDGETTCIGGDYHRFLREYVAASEFGISQESFLFGFRESGRLPDTPSNSLSPFSAPDPTDRPAPEVLANLSDEEIATRYLRICYFASAKSLLRRIRHIIPGFPNDRSEKEAFLRCYYRQMGRMECEKENAFGAGALCHTLTLPAGGECEVRFVYSWYFPHHFSESGEEMGHYYEKFFQNAFEVTQDLAENRLDRKAATFADLLFDTTLPEAYPECWSSQLSTLVKCSWWLRDGKFGIWEGLGYCGFHTTDITYHASFGLLALFPSLQLRQMEMGAAFQREDGRVHHFFTPDLYHTDWGFDRVDMNPQFVLMVCRDYLFTGDEGYLDRMYTPVVRAVESIALLDQNGDGLPDTDTGRNTYDAWHLSGTPCYISILWLAALKAGTLLADRRGDTKNRKKWSALLSRGRRSLEKLLWNGEYYDLWRTDDATDGCLMTDQLDGEWFLRMIGLDGNLPDRRVRRVLSTIWRHNYTPETGLVNASCPEGHTTTLYTHQNCQAEAEWTGIGYAFAALLLIEGKQKDALTAVETVNRSQARFGHYWDHWECGYRYSRPLSSWSTLHAALGLGVDAPKQSLTLRPVIRPTAKKSFRAPICTPEGIGTAEFTAGVCTIRCTEGSFPLSALRLPADDWTSVTLDGSPVDFTLDGDTLRFATPVTVGAGAILQIFHS